MRADGLVGFSVFLDDAKSKRSSMQGVVTWLRYIFNQKGKCRLAIIKNDDE
jgi:hypothetical protein